MLPSTTRIPLLVVAFALAACERSDTGGLHAVYHTMPIGLTGTGAESGEEFRVKAKDHGSFGQTTMGLVGSYRQVLKLVSTESDRSFSLIVRGHYRINANGQIVVDREQLAADCEA